MVAKSVKWALASLVIFPPAAFALGLGDVRLISQLNAPLDAEIELIGATPEEMASLKAQIASRDTFTRYGLDYPAALGNITLSPSKKPDGKEVLRVRSAETITEPFLTLLVEVNWARGRLVREYTMLLDPPVFAPNSQQANAPVAAPTTGDGARGGQIERAPAPAPAPSEAEPRRSSSSEAAAAPAPEPSRASAAPPPSSSGESSRTVQSGETLSGISSQIAGGNNALTRAYMLSIYQGNPAAFDGNMNILRSGAVLRIPDSTTVGAVSPSEANSEIRRQWTAWRGNAGGPEAGATDSGRLRLVTPAEPGATGETGASSAQSSQLQGRVRDLESQLQDSKRLLELKNAEVAQLQARLNNRSAPAATPAPAEEAPPAPAAETPPPVAAETPAETPPAAAEAPPEAAPAAEAPKPVAAAQTPAEEGGSIVDTLKDYWWVLAALVVALLGFFGLRAFRSRQSNEFDDSLSRLAASGANALDSSGDTQPLRSPSGLGREPAFVVEESGSHERPRFGGDLGNAAANTRNVNVQADETISNETAINLDQGDPLAEADFHMAYGLYDQAADLVRIAISREPNRRDLKLKLIEVFFVWGNKEQFLQTARELAETREQAQSGEWEKIVIMGKQLAPDDPLFSGASGGSPFAGVDLDLEGGASRVDFDIMGDPLPDGGVDLDIGSALGESSHDPTVTDAALALHDEGYGEVSSATTRQQTQRIHADNSPTIALTDLEAPTVEQPQLYGRGAGDPTVRQKVETAMRHSGTPADQTAELAIDDLGLDLSALDSLEQANDTPTEMMDPEGPTLVAGLDERSRRIMDEAERRGSQRDMDATAISSTGSWNLDDSVEDGDSDLTMPPQQIAGYGNGAGGHDPSETSRLRTVKVEDLDFDFNDADKTAVPSMTNGSGHGLDLDIGASMAPDTAFTATQKLSSEDLALPDMEPVTMSEVGTKLDLARAYMDMGDPEGARNILEEVMTEGSVAQKQEAQRLIESLPG